MSNENDEDSRSGINSSEQLIGGWKYFRFLNTLNLVLGQLYKIGTRKQEQFIQSLYSWISEIEKIFTMPVGAVHLLEEARLNVTDAGFAPRLDCQRAGFENFTCPAGFENFNVASNLR